MKHLFTMLCPL